jgi:hypothetical protein
MTVDFSGFDEQASRELIPDNTLCDVCIHVTHGGAGDDGWLKESKDGTSLGLDCKFVVMDGPYKGVNIFTRYTLTGTSDGHREAARISGQTLRAILESAHNVKPDPTKQDPAWRQAVTINNYGDFHGLCLLVRVGVQPPKDGYAARNTIKKVIVPGAPEYHTVAPGQAAPATMPVEASPARRRVVASGGPTGLPSDGTAKPDWAH